MNGALHRLGGAHNDIIQPECIVRILAWPGAVCDNIHTITIDFRDIFFFAMTAKFSCLYAAGDIDVYSYFIIL